MVQVMCGYLETSGMADQRNVAYMDELAAVRCASTGYDNNPAGVWVDIDASRQIAAGSMQAASSRQQAEDNKWQATSCMQHACSSM